MKETIRKGLTTVYLIGILVILFVAVFYLDGYLARYVDTHKPILPINTTVPCYGRVVGASLEVDCYIPAGSTFSCFYDCDQIIINKTELAKLPATITTNNIANDTTNETAILGEYYLATDNHTMNESNDTYLVDSIDGYIVNKSEVN